MKKSLAESSNFGLEFLEESIKPYKIQDYSDYSENSNDKRDHYQDIEIHDYDTKISQLALMQNTNAIIFADPGIQKTFNSQKIMINFLIEKPNKKILLLTNTRKLAEEQFNLMTDFAPNIFEIWKEKSKSIDKIKSKDEQFKKFNLFIVRPEIFLEMLRKQTVFLKDTLKLKFSLLIIHQCHHTHDNHPYNRIMQEFYHPMNPAERPRVFGFTFPSLISKIHSAGNNMSYEKINHIFEILKKNLDADFLLIPQIQGLTARKIEISLYSNRNLKLKIYDTALWKHSQTGYSGENQKIRSLFESVQELLEINQYIIFELGEYPFYMTLKSLHDKIESFQQKYGDQIANEDQVPLEKLEKLLKKFLISLNYQDKNLISNKFQFLLDLLQERLIIKKGEEQPKAMILLEDQENAIIISNLINDYGEKKLKSKYIPGNKSFDFRKEKGSYNVLVSTFVAKEKLKIQDCKMVVAYQTPNSFYSYIEIKHKAKKMNSDLCIFINSEEEERWHRVLLDYNEAIELMEEMLEEKFLLNVSEQSETDDSLEEEKEEDGDELIGINLVNSNLIESKKNDLNFHYFRTKTDRIISTEESVELLSLLCSNFFSDDLVDTNPRYHFLKTSLLGYLCCVYLPPIPKQKLKFIMGGFAFEKQDAKKLAAYNCCKKLYNEGLLTKNIKLRFSQISLTEYLLQNTWKYDRKDSIYYTLNSSHPSSLFNPFKLKYEKSENDSFVGYLYLLEFSKEGKNDYHSKLKKEFSLGFVYYNDKLKNVELNLDNNSKDQAKVKFRLLKKICFTTKEYEKHLKISRWLDATVRSWDVNFFEMWLNSRLKKKNSLYKARRNLNGIEMEIHTQPIFPFYWILDRENNASAQMMTIIDDYLKEMWNRYEEMNEAATTDQKTKLDKTYSNKFKKNPSEMSRIIVQSSITLKKYVIVGYNPIKTIDLLECKSDNISLQLKLIEMIETNYNFVLRSDDYILRLKSLNKFSEQIMNGEDTKAFMEDNYGVTDEFLEFPLELGLILQLHQFKRVLVNLRDYLIITHFRDTVLAKIEHKIQYSERCIWEPLNNIEKLDLPLKEMSTFLEDQSNLNMINRKFLATQNTQSTTFSPNIGSQNTFEDKKVNQNVLIEGLKLAMTTKQYDKRRNNERKAWLGDIILKLLASIKVFAERSFDTEYELHFMRARIINSLNLFKQAKKNDLCSFVLNNKKGELPFSYVKKEEEGDLEDQQIETHEEDEEREEESDLSEEMEIHKDEEDEEEEEEMKNILNDQKEELDHMVIANVVKALACTYSQIISLQAAQRFLNSIGVLQYQDLEYNFTDSKDIKTRISAVETMKEFIQKKLNDGQIYKFENSNFILQALCHRSTRGLIERFFGKKKLTYLWPAVNGLKIEETENYLETKNLKNFEDEIKKINEITEIINSNFSNERLVFLGDAILDYYLGSHLYQIFPNADASKMTIMKDSVINSHVLSLICMKNEFDKLLVSDIPSFKDSMIKVRIKLDTYLKDIESYFDFKDYTFIKATGDIIKALIGAVYIDSRQDLQVTSNVIGFLCDEMINKYANESYLTKSPQYLFGEYCKKMKQPEPKIRRFIESSEDENANNFGVYVLEESENIYAKYAADTTLTYLIKKRLYEEALKQVYSLNG